MLAHYAVPSNPSKPSHLSPLHSHQHAALTPLAATLIHSPASVANKGLTETLNPLDATLTKKRGGGRVDFLLPRIVHAALARDSSPFALYGCALFCTHQKPTLLFSSNSALFRKNTRGWGVPLLSVLLNWRSPRPIWRFKFFFFSRLSAYPQ